MVHFYTYREQLSASVRPFGLQKECLGRLIGQPQDNSGLGAL